MDMASKFKLWGCGTVQIMRMWYSSNYNLVPNWITWLQIGLFDCKLDYLDVDADQIVIWLLAEENVS